MADKRLKWVYIALSGLVLLLVFLLILGVYSAAITLSVTTYFFLLVIAALSATAFLTGALRSSASYEGKVYNGKLKLSGSVVVFLVILAFGYKYRPVAEAAPFDLTIYAYGEKGRSHPVKNGIIRIQEENETKSAAIDSNGRAVFPNVSAAYLGKKITVTSAVEGFHIPGGDTQVVVPPKSLPVIFLQLSRDNDSLLVRGNVTKDGRKVVASAVLTFTEFSKKTVTDGDGSFRIYLPVKEGYKTGLLIRSNDRIVFNSDVIVSNVLNIETDE